jgi:hypothetical protein
MRSRKQRTSPEKRSLNSRSEETPSAAVISKHEYRTNEEHASVGSALFEVENATAWLINADTKKLIHLLVSRGAEAGTKLTRLFPLYVIAGPAG